MLTKTEFPALTSSKLNPESLHGLLDQLSRKSSAPVILCIGTDRIIGDTLGPVAGSLLQKKCDGQLTIYGTLENTVHALNLPQVNSEIKKKHPDRPVLAIDASLGTYENIGSVFVRPGHLYPGAGVCKSLPKTGDIAITGIVNGTSSSPYLDLQTVRLSTIMQMAEEIAECILQTCL